MNWGWLTRASRYLDLWFPFWQKALPLGCLAVGLILLGDRALSTAWIASLWIMLWGVVGLGLGLAIASLRSVLISLGLISLGLVLFSYALLPRQVWVLLVPTLSSLLSTCFISIWISHLLKESLSQQRRLIEQTFDAVHNGPLQTLALLYRQVQAQEMASGAIAAKLGTLDQQIRAVYDSVDLQTRRTQSIVLLDENTSLNLDNPLSTLLSQVYEHTLNRPFPGFQTLRISTIPNFSSVDSARLDHSQKRGLCLFLEEALCNIGKYGQQVTYIHIICQHADSQYAIEVVNSTLPATQTAFESGYGTYQAIRLAKQLGGHFQRFLDADSALHCRITWTQPQTILSSVLDRIKNN